MYNECIHLTEYDQPLLQLADKLVASVQTFMQSDVLIREEGHTSLQIIQSLNHVGCGGGHHIQNFACAISN